MILKIKNKTYKNSVARYRVLLDYGRMTIGFEQFCKFANFIGAISARNSSGGCLVCFLVCSFSAHF